MKTILFVLIYPFIFFHLISCSNPNETQNQNTVVDIDDNVYKIIKIGNQWWMAENLKVTKYQNGDDIQKVTNDSLWSIINFGAYCIQKNADSNISKYGFLYNRYSVIDSRNIAPEGWHVPTDQDWKILEMHIGMSETEADANGTRGNNEGGKLKEVGTIHWKSPNFGATNEFRFSALPGGGRLIDGTFTRKYIAAKFWTSSQFGDSYNWYRSLGYSNSKIFRFNQSKNYGSSVRCIKN